MQHRLQVRVRPRNGHTCDCSGITASRRPSPDKHSLSMSQFSSSMGSGRFRRAVNMGGSSSCSPPCAYAAYAWSCSVAIIMSA